MIETHAHLDFPQFDDDREAAIKRAADAGIHTIINIGTDWDSCDRVIELAEAHPRLFAAVGIHPHDAKIWEGDRSSERLKTLAEHPKVVAIGEIGLDYYRNNSPRDKQRVAFVEQIAVAKDMNLPIVIHNRDAFNDIFEVLLMERAYDVGGVLHCFSEGVAEAEKSIDLGFHLSVNGILTYKKATMAEVGKSVRLDRLLLETDCPFLAPHPHRGKRNEPAYVAFVGDKLAELRGTPVDEIADVTDENANRLFRLPPLQ
ncbi:MAG: YchF/TatD family DNA exonuclease [candidate division Zixibacteria bacterium]|nr:YchF/TatD family DNA exonuclease [candidate division Zixibacteria bacterium]